MRAAALILALAAPLASPVAAEDFVLGTDGELPRLAELRDGELSGYEPALAAEICRLADLTCRWEIMPFDRLDAALRDGRIDAIMSGMASTFERRERYAMTTTYTRPGTSFYAGLTTRTFWGPGARVAAVPGTLHAERLQDENRQLVPVADADEMMRALRSGRADAAFGPPHMLNPLVREEGLVRMTADLPISSGNAIALRLGEDEMKARLNAAIGALQRDGTIRRLQQEWLQ